MIKVGHAELSKPVDCRRTLPAGVRTCEQIVLPADRSGEFIVHLIFKYLKTLTSASRNSADTDDLFVRSPW